MCGKTVKFIQNGNINLLNIKINNFFKTIFAGKKETYPLLMKDYKKVVFFVFKRNYFFCLF
jgi:hypothetical protein